MKDLWQFSVIAGPTVASILQADADAVVECVRRAYLAHEAGEASGPPSQFLRFSDMPDARIISLPATLSYGEPVSGVKWISSYPSNIASGMPRASAVLILNRRDTGHPFALLEASIISASRTAAAAVLAAEQIGRVPSRSCTLGVIGGGLIARYTLELFLRRGWRFRSVLVHDSSAASARHFVERAAQLDVEGEITGPEPLIRRCEVVLFATTAGAPHIDDPTLFRPDATILHTSLRDLAPTVILAGTNIVDDVDHCLRASTSLHLTEGVVNHRRFITGTLGGLIRGELQLPGDRPVIFSPFGMGILDVALGRHVYERAVQLGLARPIENFFHETVR